MVPEESDSSNGVSPLDGKLRADGSLSTFASQSPSTDFRSDIRRQRIAPLAQREARAEMPRDALLFDGGPATIHRQDHKSCPRQPVQDAQMQAGVAQGDADDGVRR